MSGRVSVAIESLSEVLNLRMRKLLFHIEFCPLRIVKRTAELLWNFTAEIASPTVPSFSGQCAQNHATSACHVEVGHSMS